MNTKIAYKFLACLILAALLLEKADSIYNNSFIDISGINKQCLKKVEKDYYLNIYGNGLVLYGNEHDLGWTSEFSAKRSLFIKNIVNIKTLLSKYDIKLLVVSIPNRAALLPSFLVKSTGSDSEWIAGNKQVTLKAYSSFLNDLDNSNIKSIDVVSRLNKLIAKNISPVFLDEAHWSEDGAKLVAQAVAGELAHGTLNLVATPSDAVRVSIMRPLANYLRASCNISIPDVYYKDYHFSRISSENQDTTSGESLFGEVPENILVGTSYSEENSINNLKFADFISLYSKSDIINFSRGAGGVAAGFRDFIDSSQFKNTGSRVLVWEFPFDAITGDLGQLAQIGSAIKFKQCNISNEGSVLNGPMYNLNSHNIYRFETLDKSALSIKIKNANAVLELSNSDRQAVRNVFYLDAQQLSGDHFEVQGLSPAEVSVTACHLQD